MSIPLTSHPFTYACDGQVMVRDMLGKELKKIRDSPHPIGTSSKILFHQTKKKQKKEH